MEKILIFIKHRLSFLWQFIEWGNSMVFSLFFTSKMQTILPGVFKKYSQPPFDYRKLDQNDAEGIFDLINRQESTDLTYFHPHEFDIASIKKQLSNPAFEMMGAFDHNKLVGYFFLRLFANKECFVGRLIDIEYRGIGIGNVMNKIMYETAWRMNFRCLSTISKNNMAVMNAHAKNRDMVIRKELNNDYLLVEFVKNEADL